MLFLSGILTVPSISMGAHMLCYVRSFMFVVKVKVGQCKNYLSIIMNLVDEDNWSAVGCVERHASRLFLRQCDIIKLKLSITLQKSKNQNQKNQRSLSE